MVIITKSHLNASHLSFRRIAEKCDLLPWLPLVNVILSEKKDRFFLNNHHEAGYNYHQAGYK